MFKKYVCKRCGVDIPFFSVRKKFHCKNCHEEYHSDYVKVAFYSFLVLGLVVSFVVEVVFNFDEVTMLIIEAFLVPLLAYPMIMIKAKIFDKNEVLLTRK